MPWETGAITLIGCEGMKIKEIDLPVEYESAYIIPISDTHIGDPEFKEQKLINYIKWIKETPNARVILVGDIMNTAIKDSVSDGYAETMNPNQQLKYATALFEPIRDKIIAVTDGNHERRIQRSTSINTTELLAQNLGAYYRENGLFLKVKLGKDYHHNRVVYTIYATHGFGGGKKPGAKANNLKSLAEIVLADVYIMGHVHHMTTFQDIFYVPDTRTNSVTELKRTYVSSSSFVGWGGYSERCGFSPSKLGTPRIRLAGDRKDVHVSI